MRVEAWLGWHGWDVGGGGKIDGNTHGWSIIRNDNCNQTAEKEKKQQKARCKIETRRVVSKRGGATMTCPTQHQYTSIGRSTLSYRPGPSTADSQLIRSWFAAADQRMIHSE